MNVIFTEIIEQQLAGYDRPSLVGVHHRNHARLYKLDKGNYVMVNPAFDPDTRPACRGVLVENTIYTVIGNAYSQPDLRVFYPGITGPLGLNLPAVQNTRNEWLYYIAENQRDAFFAFDFKRVSALETQHG